MKRQKQKGFSLFLVIMTIPLAGAALMIVSAGSHTMVSDTNRAHLQACRRNLAASGWAWVKYAAATQNPKLQSQEIKLNIDSMHIPQGSITVSQSDYSESGLTFEINTFCARSKMHIKHIHKIHVTDESVNGSVRRSVLSAPSCR